MSVLCDHDQKLPTKGKCLCVCLSVCLSHHILIWVALHTCFFISQVNSCQLSNNFSMVGCVLTHTPHKYDITTAFIEEVEKVERKQCDNIHS